MNDGFLIPQVGLGVYKVADDDAADVVREAIRVGYRHVDTAKLYDNEEGVGRGIRESDVPREDLFVTTKVWNDDHAYDRTLRAFDASLERLALDYVDLYLIHWPVPSQDLYVETWKALVQLRESGRVRSIGVSNFTERHIDRLVDETGVTPAVNQIELHPRLPQAAVREYDAANGVLTEAWSPLARGGVLTDPTLIEIAAKHDRSPAQVVIRWHIELGNVVIPKSVTPDRIASNFDVFDFALDSDDLAKIATLDSASRTGRDPDLD
ncbi:aldo/keto reductase [Herbiconiux sp. L3-i23]|uniref:aldo/keto reductase n=1 Tax=Herbiconiux sp. L3-i23 TaxID=2905871 RepID=UPI00205EF4A3|nr:aldo/keto reductase [Herbiconiux sp. L3-i23]BDI23659.1 putative oxidoreductase [Herbiconiux sp. L3-i23]